MRRQRGLIARRGRRADDAGGSVAVVGSDSSLSVKVVGQAPCSSVVIWV
jgi:hypothetical protein